VALAVACCPAVADGELHEAGVVPGMGVEPGEELSWMARNAATAATTTAAAAITISRRDRSASRCSRVTSGWLLGCVVGSASRWAAVVASSAAGSSGTS
jgi:hypothetical protein